MPRKWKPRRPAPPPLPEKYDSYDFADVNSSDDEIDRFIERQRDAFYEEWYAYLEEWEVDA